MEIVEKERERKKTLESKRETRVFFSLPSRPIPPASHLGHDGRPVPVVGGQLVGQVQRVGDQVEGVGGGAGGAGQQGQGGGAGGKKKKREREPVRRRADAREEGGAFWFLVGGRGAAGRVRPPSKPPRQA